MSAKNLIVVLGKSGSGKTVYSESLGHPVLHLDEVYQYGPDMVSYGKVCDWVLNHVNYPTLVVDGWVVRDDVELSALQYVAAGRAIEAHVLYTDPVELYLAQLRKTEYHLASDLRTLRAHAQHWLPRQQAYVDLIHPLMQRFAVSWVCRDESEYVRHDTPDDMLATIATDPIDCLLSWVDRTSGDPHYQTIEVDGVVVRGGYTDSEKSWNNIARFGIDWREKSVSDLGCFHGYFGFKAMRAGARNVVGYDTSDRALAVAKRLALVNQLECDFILSDICSVGAHPKDVTLIMNVLHHLPNDQDRRSVLAVTFVSSQEVVLEATRSDVRLADVEARNAGHRRVRTYASHRDGRKVAYYRRSA